MHLRQGETILKEIHRHRTPYIFKIIKIAVVALPLYIFLFMIGDEIGLGWLLGLLALVSFFVGVILTTISLDYLLDKLVVTNKRIIWVNWKSLIKKEEHEAELLDLQDIEIREKGILSRFKFFDYGMIEVETASSKICITFEDCPHPTKTKHFILEQSEKLRGGIHETPKPPAKNEEWSVN